MSAASVMRGVGLFLMGGGVGFLVGVQTFEQKLREEYEESARAYRRAMEMTRVPLKAETPAASEADLTITVEKYEDVAKKPEDMSSMPRTFDGHIEVPEERVNKYHIPVPPDPAEGISYIEEDDYREEDERYKGQITVVTDENEISFFMEGQQILDWQERIGDTIMVDFYRLCPPDQPQVLYVRNHFRDEDYEVLRELP